MMKYFNSIKAIKRDGNINIICAWFRDKHQKNHIVQFVKELKKFLFIKCPNVFALTGEDIYGEENFGNNIQEELENATHTTANVFYDSYEELK